MLLGTKGGLPAQLNPFGLCSGQPGLRALDDPPIHQLGEQGPLERFRAPADGFAVDSRTVTTLRPLLKDARHS
ncbi:hypothetical protein BURKHO8Y_140348 [Burkholderia sp. 8Y]|nr:hypothetical protein BURKHO8Y_140348 [Burkholderia sp. 8Y]